MKCSWPTGNSPFQAAAATLLLTALAATVYAQVTFGLFRGTITDPSGSPLAGSRVTFTEQQTQLSRITVTNLDGSYEARGLLPGTYTMTVEAPGFKKYENKDLVLFTQQTRMVDARLELGALTETVSVTSEAPVIQTDSGSLASTISGSELRNLFVNTGSGSTAGSAEYMAYDRIPGGFSWGTRMQAHGGHANESRGYVDGIQAQNAGYFRPPPEVQKEARFVMVNAPAEYQTSATVMTTSKSGTNELHATAKMIYQNQALNALAPAARSRPPGIPIRQWSYEAGGPVIIPKLYNGKNRTFWHFLAQPLSRVSVANVVDQYVSPTDAMRSGNLGIYGRDFNDPTTGQPFPGRQIPVSRINPIAANTLKLIPLPNYNTASPSLTLNYQWQNRETRDADWVTFRIDHQINSRNLVNFRYWRFANLNTSETWDAPASGPSGTGPDGVRAFTIQDSHTFSPSIINEFKIGRNRIWMLFESGGRPGSEIMREIGLTGLDGRTPSDKIGWPIFSMQTVGVFWPYSGRTLLGSNPGGFLNDTVRWQVDNILTINRGKHFMKMGVNALMPVRRGYSNGAGGWGSFSFNGLYSGNDFADFLLGLPENTSITTFRPDNETFYKDIGFFFQDDFKVSQTLTLNLGMRYQLITVPHDGSGMYYNFDVPTLSVVVPDEASRAKVVPAYPGAVPIRTASEAGYPTKLVNGNHFEMSNFNPRFGLAWRPFGLRNTVFRSAYGIYTIPEQNPDRGSVLGGRLAGPFQLGEAFGPSRFVNGVPELTLDRPFPAIGRVGLVSVVSVPTQYRRGYNQQWNATVEHELPSGIGVRVSYVGTKGTGWRTALELQRPEVSLTPFAIARRTYRPDVFASITFSDPGGNATYHSLETEVTRQFSRGLFVRGHFTFSRPLNDVSGGEFGNTTGAGVEYPRDRAREKGIQDGSEPMKTYWSAVYELPFGRGRRFLSNPGSLGASALDQIVGGWTVSSEITWIRGRMFTPMVSGSDSGNIGLSSQRADAVCDGNVKISTFQYWNRDCYAQPPKGRMGTAGRGSLLGPAHIYPNLSIFKDFRLVAFGDTKPFLRFGAYMTNWLNHPGRITPLSTDIRNPNFGRFNNGATGSRLVWLQLSAGF